MLRKLFVLYTGAWLAGSRFYRQGRHSREVHRMGGAGAGLQRCPNSVAESTRTLRPRPASCGAAANKIHVSLAMPKNKAMPSSSLNEFIPPLRGGGDRMAAAPAV